ncbi:MAG: hypothetical protein ACOYOS_00200 [Syntrophales bacterium]
MADPTLTTDDVTDIEAHSFVMYATMTSGAGHTIQNYGFCCMEGATGDPVRSLYVDNYTIADGDPGASQFQMTFEGVDQGTSYRVRPWVYVQDEAYYAYGPTVTVETPWMVVGRYWVGGTGYFINSSKWAETSGGTGGASVPMRGDTAYIDENSGAPTVCAYGGGAKIGCLIIVDPECDPPSFYIDAATVELHGDLTNISRFEWSNSSSNKLITNGFSISAYDQIIIAAMYSEGFEAGVWLGDSVLSVTSRAGAEWCDIRLERYKDATFDGADATVRFDCRECPSDNSFQLYGGVATNPDDDYWDEITLGTVEILFAGSLDWTGSLTAQNLSIIGDGRLGFGALTTNSDPFVDTVLTILGNNGFTAEGVTRNGLILDSWEGTLDYVYDPVTEEYVYDSPYKSGPWSIQADSGTMEVTNCSLSNSEATGAATFVAYDATDGGGNTGWTFPPDCEESLGFEEDVLISVNGSTYYDGLITDIVGIVDIEDVPTIFCEHGIEDIFGVVEDVPVMHNGLTFYDDLAADSMGIIEDEAAQAIIGDFCDELVDCAEESTTALGLSASDSMALDDAGIFGRILFVSDTVFIYPNIITSWGVLINESIAIADVILGGIYLLADEYVFLGEEPGSSVKVQHIVGDQVLVFDTVDGETYWGFYVDESGGLQEEVEEEIELGDSSAGHAGNTLCDVISLGEIAVGNIIFSRLAVESLTFADISSLLREFLIEEGFEMGDVDLAQWVFNTLVECGFDIGDIAC